MTTETAPVEQGAKKVDVKVQRGGSNETVYAMGLIGAAMYYIGRADTPQKKVQGFFKAFIWPVTLVYEALKFFNKE